MKFTDIALVKKNMHFANKVLNEEWLEWFTTIIEGMLKWQCRNVKIKRHHNYFMRVSGEVKIGAEWDGTYVTFDFSDYDIHSKEISPFVWYYNSRLSKGYTAWMSDKFGKEYIESRKMLIRLGIIKEETTMPILDPLGVDLNGLS